MSDTSVGSERSVDVCDEDVETCDAGVQTCLGNSPRTRQSSSCSDHSTGSAEHPVAGGDHMGHPKISWQDKLVSARKYKLEGNEKYKAGMHRAAIGKYHRALLFLKGIREPHKGMRLLEEKRSDDKNPISEEALNESSQLECDCYNNLSACILHSSPPAYSKVLQYSENVLKVQPENVKALYRKGVALYNLKDPSGALASLEKAKQLPEGEKDTRIQRLAECCGKLVKEQDKELRKTYANMFESLSLRSSGPSGGDDDEDVFTDDTDHPGIVQPQRKLEKASSLA